MRTRIVQVAASAACSILVACSGKPLVPYSVDTPPLALVPATQAGVLDKRARFREIYCAVLESRGPALPDYRPCGEALTTVGKEPAGTDRPVDLGPSRRHLIAAMVPGVGYACIASWLEPTGSARTHVRAQGYDMVTLDVDALSSTGKNARRIRDAVLAIPREEGLPRLVLIGYSKGAPDILDAVVSYPEIRDRVAAVVSVAGAIGGSPIANDFEQYHAELFRYFPGSSCEPEAEGDGGAVESLRPGVRKAWLAENPLPPELPYYSVVAYPSPERISLILESSYDKLASIDARNDGQLVFYDQVIPGSTLMAYVNADHWAIVIPIARSHEIIESILVTQNDYPREALLEAILRFVEEDLAERGN